ncbi:MAG: SWIM zinc finger family protein [Acidimicrobiales bacterium]
MSPPRQKPGAARKAGTDRNHASAAAVGDLQGLIDQVQALRRRHKANPSAQSAAELSRLREQLLEALDLDDDDEEEEEDDVDAPGEFSDEDSEAAFMDGVEDEIWEEDESGEWRSRRDWSRFRTAKRIPVEDGLELRSRRGAIGESWWSRRFLSAVESILTGGRLTRGRTYARQGQVIDLGIGSGLVVAQVQGSRRTPYGVQISMPAASDARWEAIVDTLAAQAGYAARLLAGELPHEIEDVFAEAGVALFPERGSHLTTSCTCPDWATPCKHAAAVCYLMAEAFDDDPFLLLAFRGREREALLDELRDRRGLAVDDGGPAGVPSLSAPPSGAAPLADSLTTFWSGGAGLAEVHCLPRATEAPGAVLRLLPRGVLVVRGKEVADLLEPAYARVTADAEGRAFGSGSPSKSGAKNPRDPATPPLP